MLTSLCGTDFHWSMFLCLCLNHLLYEGWSIVYWLPRYKHINCRSSESDFRSGVISWRHTAAQGYFIYSDYCWTVLTYCHSSDSLSQNYWIFSRFSSDVFVCWCWFCTAGSSVTCSTDDRCSGGSCCPAAGLTDRCTCDSPARADC